MSKKQCAFYSRPTKNIWQTFEYFNPVLPGREARDLAAYYKFLSMLDGSRFEPSKPKRKARRGKRGGRKIAAKRRGAPFFIKPRRIKFPLEFAAQNAGVSFIRPLA